MSICSSLIKIIKQYVKDIFFVTSVDRHASKRPAL